MLESDILYNAVENLKKSIKLPVYLLDSNQKNVDAILNIGSEGKYLVEVKREVHKSNLPNILAQLSNLRDLSLLVAKTISKSTKEILFRKNISYLDMAGNCFIQNEDGLYIQIDGRKNTVTNKRKHKAFNKNGIKLIYALLLKEDLINQTYSQMAKAADISKSTVGSILDDLQERDFLLKINTKKRKLSNKGGLLSEWIKSYNEKLKPTLIRGKFRLLPNKLHKWKQLNLGEAIFWGGEPAADILTNYLSPGEWTIYSNIGKNLLLKNLGLVPDPKSGNVIVYSIFWNPVKNLSFNIANSKTVNPLLVYADLLATNDSRNFETANKIYEQYLSAHFTK